MTMKSLISNMKAALRGKSKRSRSESSKSKPATKTAAGPLDPLMDCSSRTCDTESSEFSGLYEQAFFRDELFHLKQNPTIRRVTLQDFIQRYERDDLRALYDILGCDSRKWKSIKFMDTVDGDNYRRWLFKKENLRRALEKHCQKVPIIFEEHIKVDMDEMPSAKIAALLKAVKKDLHVRTLSFDGFLNHKEVTPVIKSLVKLLDSDQRRWKKIVLRCSFDGEEFDEWNAKIQQAKKLLGDITSERGVPIVLAVC